MARKPEITQVGRLAMREEGEHWVAYYARTGTMKDAIWLGAIHMRFVEDAKRRQVFMGLMREAVGDIIEDIVGARPVWPEPEGEPAPEHERAGRA